MKNIRPNHLLPVAGAALWPFLHVLAVNWNQTFSEAGLAIYALVTLVGCLVLAAVAMTILRRSDRSRIGATAAVAILLFFTFPIVSGLLEQFGIDRAKVVYGAWGLYFLSGAVLAWYFSRSAPARSIFYIFLAVVLVIPAGQVAVSLAQTLAAKKEAMPRKPAGAPVKSAKIEPNVYFFILDEYGRSDKLREITGFNNQPFIDALYGRGFDVLDKANSNYMQTAASISTTMSMNYVYHEGIGSLDSMVTRGSPLHAYRLMNGQNEVVRQFRALGYKYVDAKAEGVVGAQCTFPEQDYCIKGKGGVGELEVTLLGLTPLLLPLRMSVPMYMSYSILMPDDVIEAMPKNINAPTLLFAHIISPHPPFSRKADCSLREIESGGEWDFVGQLRWSLGLPRDKAEAYYVENVECLNKRMLHAVDLILDKHPDAIILIQGDHGTYFLQGGDFAAPLSSWTKEQVEERVANFNAIRLPKQCAQMLYPTMTPVNNFRVVLACIEGRAPDYLSDYVYLSTYEGPDATNTRLFKDLTPLRPQTAGGPPEQQ